MNLAAFTFTDRVRPIVEIGTGDTRIPVGSSRWDVAHWDNADARWAGMEPTWVDVTCECFSARCQYGRDHANDRFAAGVATILASNASGWADPNASLDPNALTMRPGRSIRIGVDHIGYGVRWLFRGFVDAITPTYTPVELDDMVQIDCIDALGEVNRVQLVALATPAYGGETADIRTARILDLAQWEPLKRDIQPSGTTLIASDLGGQVADLLSQAADSAGGAVWGDLNANVAFRNRDWQMFTPGTPVDGSIGNVDPGTAGYWTPTIPEDPGYLDASINTGGTEVLTDSLGRVWTVDQRDAIVRGYAEIPPVWVEPVGDVCPVAWSRPFDRADMSTRVILGRGADDAVQVDDLAAQLLYGIEPFVQTDLLTERDDVLTFLAQRILRTRSPGTSPRVRSVLLDARTADNAIDLMTTVDVWKPSRYRCRLRQTRGDVFDAEHFATGAVHELTPSSWTLQLSLDLAAPWQAVGGRWDQAGWDKTTWSDAALTALLADAEIGVS